MIHLKNDKKQKISFLIWTAAAVWGFLITIILTPQKISIIFFNFLFCNNYDSQEVVNIAQIFMYPSLSFP